MFYLLALIITIGIIIFITNKFFFVDDDATIKKVDELLPQKQCGRCGYAGCLDFAKALVGGKTNSNQCIFLGDTNKQKISKLIKTESLDTTILTQERKVAFIDETRCIGCTKCAKDCPTDCIIGSAKKAHTVIQKNCSGCGLCVSTCPVKAIQMKTIKSKDIK